MVLPVHHTGRSHLNDETCTKLTSLLFTQILFRWEFLDWSNRFNRRRHMDVSIYSTTFQYDIIALVRQ